MPDSEKKSSGNSEGLSDTYSEENKPQPAASEPDSSSETRPRAGTQLPFSDLVSSERQSRLIAEYSKTWHAPLPPPEVIEAYNLAHPGASELIFTAFREEGVHRRELEKRGLEASIQDAERDRTEARIGQLGALLIFFVAVAAGTYLTLQGHELIGGGMIGVPVLTFATAFLRGRWEAQTEPRDEEDSEKTTGS